MDYNTITVNYPKYFMDYHHIYPEYSKLITNKIMNKKEDTVEDFGKYQQLLLIIGMFGVVFSMGIPVAISYFHGQTNKLYIFVKMLIYLKNRNL